MHAVAGNFIDGEWRPSTGTGSYTVINPATEEPFGTVPLASEADVDRAVRAADAAMRTGKWPAMSLEERCRIVERVAEAIERRAPELARLRSGSMGAPYASSLALSNSVKLIEMYLRSARQVRFARVNSDPYGNTYIVRKPVGVVAGIVPWNVPVRNELKKIIPAVLAGCAVVLKPALESPFTGAALMEIIAEAGMPPGVVNLVSGGPETGEALVRHPLVRKIAFTGSSATGARIAALAAPSFKRLQLELGGKSAAIVLDDADLDTVIPSLRAFGFGNSGQVCASLSRVLAPRDMHRDLAEALAAAASTHVLGDPMDARTTLGPLVTARQRERVLGYIESGIREGATLIYGGGIPACLPRGWYVQPTVFTDVAPRMAIAQEEIFGPVVSVIPYDDVDEAVAIANDSRYGLHGAVFSRDPRRALEIGLRVDTGTLAVNGFDVPLSAPFGGVKDSGVGRENGVEGYDSYLEYHSYNVPPELAAELCRTDD